MVEKAEAKARPGVVDDVAADILKVFEKREWKDKPQKDGQARGLLKAVRDKLNPKQLFLCGESEHCSQSFIVESLQTIAQLQDYLAMSVRRIKTDKVALMSEKEISLRYVTSEPTFGVLRKAAQGGGRKKKIITVDADGYLEDSDDDEGEGQHQAKRRRSEGRGGATVLMQDINTLEAALEKKQSDYDDAKQQLDEAKSALDTAKAAATLELGTMPQVLDPDDAEALKLQQTYLANFRKKIKEPKNRFDGARGAKSCKGYAQACKDEFTNAISKLEAKYKEAREVDGFEDYDYKNLNELRSKYNITPEWLSYEIKQSSIHGRGLFATRLIKKDEVIGKYTGPVVAEAASQDEMDELVASLDNDRLLSVRNFAGDLHGFLAIDGTNCDMSLINDGYPNEERQNVYFTSGGYVKSLVDIPRGTELLTNYGESYREAYIYLGGEGRDE